jgi:hypothetical protein
MNAVNVVLVDTRSVGPDEYTYKAGWTGCAGKLGSVIHIVSDVDVQKVTAWENMLDIKFISCVDPKLIGQILDQVNGLKKSTNTSLWSYWFPSPYKQRLLYVYWGKIHTVEDL